MWWLQWWLQCPTPGIQGRVLIGAQIRQCMMVINTDRGFR
jgi:hypothetical protein